MEGPSPLQPVREVERLTITVVTDNYYDSSPSTRPGRNTRSVDEKIVDERGQDCGQIYT